MGEDKQIFLFFQLPVVFPAWNILVINWCKADKKKKMFFLHLQKRLQLSKASSLLKKLQFQVSS